MSDNTNYQPTYDQIIERLNELIINAMPDTEGVPDPELPFLEMGANSLVLMDVQRTIQNEFNIEVTIGQFFEELTNIHFLVQHIVQESAAKATAESAAKATAELTREVVPELGQTPIMEAPMSSTPQSSFKLDMDVSLGSGNGRVESDTDIQTIFARQIEATSQALNSLVERQLSFLAGGNLAGDIQENNEPAKVNRAEANTTNSAQKDLGVNEKKGAKEKPKSSIQPQKMLSALETRARGLTERQQKHLEKLIADYNKKTASSKEHTQKYRAVLADSRAAIGFRFTTKEMLYPLVSNKSRGSRVWDIDGNEYVDISMGQGVSLFGHHPEFIEKELHRMVLEGVEMGPRPDNVGEVAELICGMTGFDRVTFTNSGTEAVMAAMRLARAATKRDKIVTFEGAWHGHSDSVMGMRVEEVDGEPVSKPISPGTPMGAVKDHYVLVYDEPESLDFIRKHGHTIAAVMVEPVQSRNPAVQPAEFLKELRSLTLETGSLLIFDEMITGFRSHQGGAQAWFDIEADMATYGKVIGGGLPIGVVAGKSHLMDPIDGGMWSYGDISYPEVNRVVFGGTFCQHPLSMTASLATLKHLKKEGKKLQQELNAKTKNLAEELNEWFKDEEVPISIAYFGSLFRFEFNTNFELLYYHMNLRGVFVWEWRNCFLSTAHTDRDIEFIISVVKESVLAMRDGGFIPPKSNAHPTNSSNPKHDMNSEGRVDERRFSLSLAQKQLATLSAITPEASLAYHISPLLSMKGSLDIDSLKKAVEMVVQRHEALRTTIIGVDEGVVSPKISTTVAGFFNELDLSKKKNKKAALDQALQQQATTPFDLSKDSLFNCTLIRLADNDHRLLCKAHHIIVDGLSMNIIIQELASCYTNFVNKTPFELPSAKQFSDVLAWQKEQDFSKQEAYWLHELAEPTSALVLPSDKPNPTLKSYKGGRISKEIDSNLVQSLKQFSKKNNATEFMTFFAIHALWLHKMTGQNELIIGMPVAARSFKGSESVVGYCTHLIPIKSNYDPNASFQTFLTSIRKKLLQGYQHQDYPYSQLLNALKTTSNHGAKSPIQVVFNVDRVGEHPNFANLNVEWASQKVFNVAFDLVFNIMELEEQVVIECDYSTDKFSEQSINQFVDYFQTLCHHVLLDIESPMSNLSLMNKQAVQDWVVKWNNTKHEYPPFSSVVDWFDSIAEKHKDDLAVTSEESDMTYAQLSAKSNALASMLVEKGYGKGSLVGMHLNRSVDVLVAIFGIWKAGASYVPIDPSYPKKRMQFILDDCQPVCVISTKKEAEFFKGSKVEQLMIDADELEWERASATTLTRLSSTPEREDLAYVMYTSGSTGEPKGAMITHKGLLNYIHWATSYYKSNKGLGAPVHGSIAFDATITSLLTPLLSGTSVHLMTTEGIGIESLHQLLAERKKYGKKSWSMLKLTPSHLDLLSATLANEDKKGVCNCLILGGEALSYSSILPWREYAPKTRIVNEYGPTETVVGCAVYEEKKSAAASASGAVPIGKPIWNTQLFVLDESKNPLPPGIEGELYIGGDGVAKGYLHRDELTKERFISLQETGLSAYNIAPAESRLYATGDRVKLQFDGDLVFLGRSDSQVKLRGYRIEIAEVEHTIKELPSIDQVKVIKERNPEKLVAFIVAKTGIQLTEAEVKSALSQSLPDYMIPTKWIFLSSLPLTVNGKVDLDSLAAMKSRDTSLNETVTDASLNKIQHKISLIWQELLDKADISKHDNFFEIGGDSMLVLPMKDRLNEAFSIECTPVDVFRYPNINVMAKHIQSLQVSHQNPVGLEGNARLDELIQQKPTLTGRKSRSQGAKKPFKKLSGR